MNALNIFEEIRFITELVIAEQLLLWRFAKRKEQFWMRSILWNVLLLFLAITFLIVRTGLVYSNNDIFKYTICIFWYIFLSLLTIVQIKSCYEITLSDTLFIVIAGYSIQHIEYIVVNEVIAMAIWSEITQMLLFYILFCVVTCAAWYWVMYRLFASKLKAYDGLIYEDQRGTIFYFTFLLLVLFTSSFVCQGIFQRGIEEKQFVFYQGAITDFFSCSFVLIVQYSVFQITLLSKEKEIVKQLLYERQKQYQLSKENIEIINHKCHDLKHQIHALRQANSKELDRYINEVEESIMLYDNVLKTDNEVLNTILSEKSLYCEKHQVKLTCIIDSSQLDFMSTLDIYALLGNALDNAIECVRKYQDIEKRVISLTISAKSGCLCIQTNNYYEGTLQFKDGLPVTTKKKKAYHGFGMKSMKHLTGKYGGTMYTQLENGIFMLQIVIPMPKEFLRLLNESHEWETKEAN